MPTVAQGGFWYEQSTAFVNEYVLNTFRQALNSQHYSISTSFAYIPLDITFRGPINLAYDENNAIDTSFSCTINFAWFLTLSFKFAGKIQL